MKTFTYSNGVGTPTKPISGTYARNFIQLSDGRFFFDKTNTAISLEYAKSKDCYEVVEWNGKTRAINLCNGMMYDTF